MDTFSWIALRAADGVGPVLFRRLLERFETPARALAASPSELLTVRGMSEAVCGSIRSDACRRFAEEECRRLERTGVRLLTFLDAAYPRRLFEIGDPPPLLYLRGMTPLWEPAVAVVGSRRASRGGLMAAEQLSAQLAALGVRVVSGLARGIDTAAHRGALQGGGVTVAVLGCGVDVQYPPENRELADRIAASGCIISEFPLGTQPLAEHFPRRNRIISGLCRGVLVVEAAEQSGSLITARYALDQGREVMAVPGPINTRSCRGSNRLIKQGAQLVDCVEDILDALALGPLPVGGQASLFSDASQGVPSSLTPREAALYELVAQGPRHLDEITAALELTAGEVSAMVLGLELKGLLVQLPGSFYSIA
ncbi:DNA-processing protein DprA [Trichlorobacter ammonificans]|uniref:Protein Smf n=1 Tax=Trichlorobacter ammonificans TaxID=2916410 RepID=A0ABM9DCJ4_9BACT|nr:DNA-processing protein DprA [Trichlorobacter ammonificans]CAH2032456.1 protein Smf [Trichlorobacter ammonificans]